MPFAVRNLLPNLALFDSGDERFTWQPKGQPGDVQVLPDSLKNHMDILLNLKLKNFALEGSEEADFDRILDERVAQMRPTQQEEPQQSLLDYSSKNAMLGFRCMGPGARGRGQCEEQVIVRQSDAKTQPPLCGQHASLASQLVYADGVGWVRTQSQ